MTFVRLVIEIAHSKIFEIGCGMVHKMLSTVTSCVCDRIPDEVVFLGEETYYVKHKRTGKYHYKDAYYLNSGALIHILFNRETLGDIEPL